MTFEKKISGVKVTDYNIIPVLSPIFTLDGCLKKIHRQKTMDFILDTFRFTRSGNNWVAYSDNDTLYKISILENYPQYEKEMVDYLGENWLKHYIRFNH